jgi:hypothetical protein
VTAHIDDYLKLRQTTLHLLTPAERIAFCSAVAAWLRHAESWIRADAAERLATAVFWESYRRDDPNAPHMTHYAHRTAWLLGEIEAAQLSHADILPAFIRHLRYRSPSGPQLPIVLAWFDRLEGQPPPGFDTNLVVGTRLLLVEPMEWSVAAPNWLALLDHPSDWVRGCAAVRLGGCDDDDTAPSRTDLFAIVGGKELLRPGIAGPFWSPSHADGGGSDTETVILWMMDLLERRMGPPPPFEDMPSNDIDFFLHELCSFSPELVDRMLRGGFVELALMTATEIRGFVEGMRPRLETLAGNADAGVGAAASKHLELYYAAD